MGPLTDQDDVQSLIPSASPVMTAAAVHGLNVEKIIGGDPAEIAKAQGLGIPVPGAAPGPAASTPPVVQSALATGAAGQNPPAPAGTSANQPQPPAPETAPVQPNGKTPFFDNFGSNLAQAQVPVTNTPNPPTDSTGAPTVPATVTPTGTADTPAVDPNQAGIQRAGQMAEGFSEKLQAQPTLAQTEAPLEAKRPGSSLDPKDQLNPMDPKYRPTKWQRFGRGVLGGVEGLARGGIRGAVLGAVDPAAVGATAYGAPNRAFSIAAQQRAGLTDVINAKEKQAEDVYKEDTGRAKDIITSVNDIGKNYAAGETAQSRVDVAQARKESADVAGQLADIKQQVADFQSQGKTPTTYEGTVAAAALEKDPVRKATLQSAAKEMEATEIKKFQYKAADPALADQRSTFRQSMIDSATEQVKALQDKYQYDPRRNQYVNPNNPNDILNPSELTDKKNEIAAKLDKDLGAKKMKPLGVRFNPSDAGADRPSGRAARQAAAQPAPAQSAPAATTQQPKRPAPPTPTVPAPQGAADMALSPADGQYHYRDSGKRDLGVVK